MRPSDRIDVVDGVEVGYSECRCDDSGCGAGDSVGREYQIVRGLAADEALREVASDHFTEFLTGDLLSLVGVDVVAMASGPVDQFVGQFVVVLQRMYQGSR